MRVLFLGGTGLISASCARLAIERGVELYLLNRGQRPGIPGARSLTADLRQPESVAAALGDLRFDAVVNFIAFTEADVERDIALFAGRTAQYVFISSASAYEKPAQHLFVTESTPLRNPHWKYSCDKIACEERLLTAWRESGFPVTIVRPSLTFDQTQIPLVLNAWQKPFTMIDRMRRGKKVIVPGDGTSPWTVTHAEDFAIGLLGLLGHAQALGHAFHITSDEALTWNQIYAQTAAAAGAELRPVHIASDFLSACVPEWEGTLLGDKSIGAIFDNSKIKRFVPGFVATIPFAEGIRRSIAWHDADLARQGVDTALDACFDRLIDAYEKGMDDAAARLRADR